MQIFRYLSFVALLLIACNAQIDNLSKSLLIQNINTIDPLNGLTANQNVYIEDGKIKRIESYKKDDKAKTNNIVKGSGKFLIPGLWDAHVHFAYMENLAPRMFDLFLVYGVTSVRDTGGKMDFVKAWKDKSLEDPTKAPRVMIAGPLLDGSPNVYDGSNSSLPPLSVKLVSEADINKEIEHLVNAGVDLLKSYEMLTPDQFRQIIKLAKENNLKVTGHVPLSMNVIAASNFGLNSMEHLRNLELSCASNDTELLAQRQKLLFDGKEDAGGILRSRIHNAQRQNAIENYDSLKASKVLDILKKNDTWQIPTLALNNAGVERPFARPDFQESFELLPDDVQNQWLENINKLISSPPREFNLKYKSWKNKMVKMIHEKGIPIMAGTDCPIAYLTPGYSLHEELAALVNAGLSPLETIKSATYLPAKYFHLENELGSLKEGQWADLLILDANPLDDIRNTTLINTVIKQGNVMDAKMIEEMKQKLQAN